MSSPLPPAGEAFDPITEVIPAVPSWTAPRVRAGASAVAWNPPPRRGAPLWLRTTVAGLGAILAVGIAGLALEHTTPRLFSALRAGLVTGPGNLVGPPATARTSATSPSGAHHSAVAPPRVPARRVAGSPALASLNPGTGRAGTEVTIIGSGFHSPSGEIVVTFSGVAASTRCPSVNECVATVPAHLAAARAVVRVHTDGGTSNGLPFAGR